MALLNFIGDEVLKEAVLHLIQVARDAKRDAEKNFQKNVIDPFSAIFEIPGFGMTFENWVDSEKSRQAQKSLQNHIGEFHQKILGSVAGWEDLGKGSVIDLISHEKKIVAEVKNKYSTISGGKLSELYYSLENQVMPKNSKYKGYTAYYVAIIPKRPIRYNSPFVPSDKEKGAKCPENELIREIDGSSFYDMVTGVENSLESLYDSIPDVLEMVMGNGYKFEERNKVRLKEFFHKAFA